MISQEYKLQNPYDIFTYLRVSDPKQNKRSPDQQHATINEVIARNACPWKEVKSYRDDGIKGRLISRRPAFQQMLRDIAVGLFNIDLIVVDTMERFGRADEIESIRRRLRVEYGVLVVAADNNFADPTGIAGKALGMVEQIRSTEEGRIKAHNVIRGKKDTLRRGRWAGGPAPFGLRLKKLIDNSTKEPEVYSIPEPDPETAWILQKTFQKAYETGWGDMRLANWFNADPEIPDRYKPMSWSTIRYWLSSTIYIGVAQWGKLRTDIINDARVIEPNPHPEEIARVENFCEPLVPTEIFNAIQAMRQKRAKPRRNSGKKLIKAIAGGISLIYPLSGMVKCSECGGCMVARPSGRKSKTGTCYTYYVCPRYISGGCANDQYVHERRLWEATVSCVRQRLFSLPASPDAVPNWFGPLVERVGLELQKLRQDRPRRAQDLQTQINDLEQRMSGWRDSLGKRELPALLRQDLENDYANAAAEKARLEADLAMEEAIERQVQTTLDPRQVLDALKHLHDVLSEANVTQINIELAKHIERIDCYPDGRVVLRGTFLGLFEGAVQLLSEASHTAAAIESVKPAAQESSCLYAPVEPRRLTRRKVNTLSADQLLQQADVDRAIDPHRFAGLAGAFIWEERFMISRKPFWAEEHAHAVLEFTEQHPELNRDAVAAHFGKTRPTIRHALRLAREAINNQGQTSENADSVTLDGQKQPDTGDTASPNEATDEQAA